MELPSFLYKRRPDTHKGDWGYVFVVGGSPGLTGAVCLAAQAALSSGAGGVKVGVPKSLHSIFEIKLTEVMSMSLDEEKGGCLSPRAFKEIKAVLNRVDVFALGCGAGLYLPAKKLILRIIKEIDKPLIIDADGINALAGNKDVLKKRRARNLILTPHLAEFSRLIAVDIDKIRKRRKELVKGFARKYNLILVLKGHNTLVSDGTKIFENKSGNPGMATAGSGDVLTGIISGLVAQFRKGKSSGSGGASAYFDAARLGVYLHGLAGDFAAKDKTQAGLIASDIIDYLPKAIKRTCRQAGRDNRR